MALTKQQAAVIEANPFALPSYVTTAMEQRIADHMFHSTRAEGHRPLMPKDAQKLPYTIAEARAKTASKITEAMLTGASTVYQIRRVTGIDPSRIINTLDAMARETQVERKRDVSGRIRYVLVTA